ncbi:hypothetical protein [Sorangium sp. So ce542]|uniref:hypothetical protein n=1 Tax=Sorangium sp. So ce542 TaxID=3133316 RepID=UPI003F63C192
MGNSKAGGEDDVTSRGKYLLISVPDFAEDPINPGRMMTSYLRIGAASTTWWNDPGGSLAAVVNLAGPAGGRGAPPGSPLLDNVDASDGSTSNYTTAHPRQVSIGAWSSDASGAAGGGGAGGGADVLALQEQQHRELVSGRQMRPTFVDDQRLREGCPSPHQLKEDQRINESSYLHSRGGWRDHSDGNRITTTYGDKVEVIRGNYKLMVMGRQDDPSKAAGLDISGQHIQDYAYTWAAFHRVEWAQDPYSGVWHQQSSTDGAVVTENFGGDIYEHKWGEHHHSTVGQESPVEKDENGRPRGNPHIIEKTWAKRIESYTGSSACRIPSIEEETWADRISSLTDAASTSETTRVSGAITSETTAGSITETTMAGAVAEMTLVGAKGGLTLAGALADLTVAANKTDVFVGATHIDLELMLLKLSVVLGQRVEIAWPKGYRMGPEDGKFTMRDVATGLDMARFAAKYAVASPLIRLGIGGEAMAEWVFR